MVEGTSSRLEVVSYSSLFLLVMSTCSRARRRTSATAVPLNNARDSLVTNRSSIGGAAPGPNGESLGGGSDADVAITYMHESQYEWFHCKPGHRQG